MINEAFKKQLEKNQPGGHVLPSNPPETTHLGGSWETPVFGFYPVMFGVLVFKVQKW